MLHIRKAEDSELYAIHQMAGLQLRTLPARKLQFLTNKNAVPIRNLNGYCFLFMLICLIEIWNGDIDGDRVTFVTSARVWAVDRFYCLFSSLFVVTSPDCFSFSCSGNPSCSSLPNFTRAPDKNVVIPLPARFIKILERLASDYQVWYVTRQHHIILKIFSPAHLRPRAAGPS